MIKNQGTCAHFFFTIAAYPADPTIVSIIIIARGCDLTVRLLFGDTTLGTFERFYYFILVRISVRIIYAWHLRTFFLNY